MSDTATISSVEAIATRTGIETSDVHAAFANDRRRTALEVIGGKPTPVEVSTIAEAVAAEEADSTVDAAPPDLTERVHASLYHVHLPKLETLGFLDLNAEADAITDYADVVEAVSL